LGSPCAMYLASAGIGNLGLIDYDEIELSNLSRQIIHKECDVGRLKVESGGEFCRNLNSNVKLKLYNILLSAENAIEIVKDYDIIVDCSDNVPTRYLLNDAAVLLKKPLVSGGALRMEGQLTVYNYNGPCYRCIFPIPPPPETVGKRKLIIGNCGSVGVVGAITGTIGSLQALQVIQIITGIIF
jgi:adenylyltransferase and sulfurtransferase